MYTVKVSWCYLREPGSFVDETTTETVQRERNSLDAVPAELV
jgi:hypothetical protein